MKRKVVQHGTNTLTISLPTDWAKRNNVKVGDELEVTDKLTKLEILKEKEEEKKEITLDIQDANSYLFKRLLGNLYRKGYDSITLHFPHENIKNIALEHVTAFLDMCIGLEVISYEGSTISIKAVASVKQEEFSNALRRFFLLSLQVVDTFYALLEQNELAKLSEVLKIEKKQNTMNLYCIRVLNKTRLLSKEDLMLHYIFIERLEEVCDEYRDMVLFMQENKISKVSNDIRAFAKQSAEYMRSIYEMYYAFDEKRVVNITAKREEFVQQQRFMLKNSSKEDVQLLNYLFNAVIKMYEASSPIVGLHIGKIIR